MANYYTQVCFKINLLTEENCKIFESVIDAFDELQTEVELTEKQLDQLKTLALQDIKEIVKQNYKEAAANTPDMVAALELFCLANCPSLERSGELVDPGARIVESERQEFDSMLFDYSESIPEGLDLLLQYAIKTYSLPPMGFCFSNTADRATTDAYGGGACWITKDNIEWLDVHRWLEERAKQ